jgi:hypothetical protein
MLTQLALLPLVVLLVHLYAHRTYIDALYRKEWVYPTVDQTTVAQTTVEQEPSDKEQPTDSEDTDSSAGIYVVSTRCIEKYN